MKINSIVARVRGRKVSFLRDFDITDASIRAGRGVVLTHAWTTDRARAFRFTADRAAWTVERIISQSITANKNVGILGVVPAVR